MTYKRLSTYGPNENDHDTVKKHRKIRRRQELDAEMSSHGCCTTFYKPRFNFLRTQKTTKEETKRNNTTEAKINRAQTKKKIQPEYEKQLTKMKQFINENLNETTSEVLDQTIENLRPSDLSNWKTSVKSSNHIPLSVDGQ